MNSAFDAILILALLQSGQNPFSTHKWTIQGSAPLALESSNQMGLIRSRDGGQTWEKASAGLPHSMGAADVAPIVAVASSPRQSGRIYCAAEVEGVFRSDDSGSTWTAASEGLPVPFDRVTTDPLLAVDSSNVDWVYALLTVPVHSHLEETSLYRSSDAGRHWMLLKKIPSGHTYTSMTIESPRIVKLQEGDESTVIRDSGPDHAEDIKGPANAIPIPPGGGGMAKSALSDSDIDNVAVLEDDGSLVLRRFGLSQTAFEFRPNAAGGFDVANTTPLINSAYLQDFTGGARQSIGDDGSIQIDLPFAFPFYGRMYSTVYLNANGNLTFGAGDSDSSESGFEFFARVPKIAAFWQDLDPSASSSGGVFTRSNADSFTATWNQVPESRVGSKNTFQIILFSSGRIHFQYGAMESLHALIGLSNGTSTSGYFLTFASPMNITGLGPAPIQEWFSVLPLNTGAIIRRFYQTHDDNFDALAVFGASEYPATLAGTGATAFHATVRNDIRGIGRSVTDFTAFYASGGRLQSYLNMNSLAIYPADPYEKLTLNNDNSVTLLGQEWGHRFLATARFRDGSAASTSLLGRDNSHWNYFVNSEGSVVEGNEWRDNGDGTFTATDDTLRYGRLDQYLMGLRPASDVPPTLIITNPEGVKAGTIASVESTFGRTNNAIRDTGADFGTDRYYDFYMAFEGTAGPLTTSNTGFVMASGRTQAGTDRSVISSSVNLRQLGAAEGKTYSVTKVPASTPRSHYYDPVSRLFTGDNIVFKGTRRDVSVDDIVAQEGVRTPAVGQGQTAFNHAFVLIVPRGKTATSSDVSRLSSLARAWETFYSLATDGRSTVSTSLARPASSNIFNTLAANGGYVYPASSRSVSVNTGYATLEPGGGGVSGVAILSSRTGTQVVSEAAVGATAPVLSSRFFAEKTSSVNTGFAAIAPTVAARLTLDLRDSAGTKVASTTLDIAAGGHVAKFATELFAAPAYSFPPSFTGSITVTSTEPVAIVALRTIVNQAGDFILTTLPAADLSVASGTDTQYIAHIADNGGYQADVILVNPSNAAIAGTAEFMTPDASTFDLTPGKTGSSVVPYSITPNGAFVIHTAGGTQSVRTGYVAVKPEAGSAAPITSAVFTYTRQGLLVAATGVAGTTPSRHIRLYYDRTAGHDTGIAIVNPPGGSAANMQLTLRNLSGSAGTPGTQTLSSRNQSARFISQIAPALPVGSRGVLEVSSDTPIAAVALRSTESGDRYLLSTLPVDDMDRLPGANVRYFPQTVLGGGYTTDFILLNSGGTLASSHLTLVQSPPQ